MAETNLNITAGRRLPPEFYTRTDVVQISKELLGKVLVTNFDGRYTAGRITETEAYRAPDDKACHAYGNRHTSRTAVMFQEGGRAYVFLCYGIHHLFNVVTAPAGMAHAVLIRAIEPLEGLEIMYARRNKPVVEKQTLPPLPGLADHAPRPVSKALIALTTGPGALCQALGITTQSTGQNLLAADSPIWIEDHGDIIAENNLQAGPRIGVDYAGECALWDWRFWIRDSPFVKKG